MENGQYKLDIFWALIATTIDRLLLSETTIQLPLVNYLQSINWSVWGAFRSQNSGSMRIEPRKLKERGSDFVVSRFGIVGPKLDTAVWEWRTRR